MDFRKTQVSADLDLACYPVSMLPMQACCALQLQAAATSRLKMRYKQTVAGPSRVAGIEEEAFMQQHTRRTFVTTAGAAVAAAVAAPKALAQQWQPSLRYPDPAVEILDPSFARYRLALASVERLATGMRWCEGPAWFGAGRYLVWSDIPNNRMMRWTEETGRVSVFRQPSNNSNGNTRDRQGRLITCEHDTRRVTRTEFDGTITTLIDKFDGKPLNSPNDVVVKSDDSIWFTDPPFGILGNYEGHMAKPELPTNVYRLDPRTGTATVAAGDVNRPNGLAFSPDESKMYIVEAAVTPRVIKVYDVTDNGTKLANGKPFITAEPGGTPDGFRLDVDGNLWCGWGMGNEKQDGVKVFDPTGKPIGFIALPERCANVCFGGVLRNRLFMTASHSLYSLYVNTQGTPGG
jgi:gluconolactonase